MVTGLPLQVVQELELSRMKQRLDVAVIRLTDAQLSEHRWPDLPDGLTDLADHNLVSYKSIRESLTCGAMWELVSHGVIYGKQQWKKAWEAGVQDRTKLKLIAVTTHHPAWLTPEAEATRGERTDSSGVYEIEFLQLAITSDFQIRFQHHGTQPAKKDGIDWQQIRVEAVPLPTAQKVTPAQPYVQNFSSGLPQAAAGFEYHTTGEGESADEPLSNSLAASGPSAGTDWEQAADRWFAAWS